MICTGWVLSLHPFLIFNLIFQYRVGPPLATMHIACLLLMLLSNVWRIVVSFLISDITDLNISFMSQRDSVLSANIRLSTRSLMHAPKFKVGFRSGLFPGHFLLSKKSMFLAFNNVRVFDHPGKSLQKKQELKILRLWGPLCHPLCRLLSDVLKALAVHREMAVDRTERELPHLVSPEACKRCRLSTPKEDYLRNSINGDV